ncbi:MAG: hypothetical protein JRF41_14310, partial [Deltaproteobacteria bacterium]|nr:hypothetical protein [Deltaproteobacteria bacterium]
MSKRRKKVKSKLPPDVVDKLEGAAAKLLAGIPGQDPLSLFQTVTADLAGYEAELIDLLGSQRTVVVLNFLYRLKILLKGKNASRSVRRAIYRLEQAGLSADDEVLDKGKPMLRPREARPAQGFLTHYEGLDIRYGMLVLPAQPSGLNTGSFVFSHSKGLESFDLMHQTEGGLRRFLKAIIDRQGDCLVEVPPEHVRFVLGETVARTTELNRTLPREYESFIKLAGTVAWPERPVIYDLINVDQVKDRIDLQAMAARLLNHEFLATWILTSELTPYLRKLDEVEGSVLVLAEHQKAERRQAVYEQAEEEIFVPEKKLVLKRCLEETALMLWQRDEKDLAEGAMALALDLEPDNQKDLGRRSDFTQTLVRFSFDEIISAGMGAEPVKERYQRSESGLILPVGFNTQNKG